MKRDSRQPRVVIEQLSPRIGVGRHPVKRRLGDSLEVGADIYTDGHDLIGARIRYRPPGESRWQYAPLRYHYEPDRWTGSLVLDSLGRWTFEVEAWPDVFGTWRADLRKRLEAGQNVRQELLVGAALLERAAASARRPRKQILAIARRARDPDSDVETRIDVLLAEDLLELVAGPLEPAQLARSTPLLEVTVDRERGSVGAWYEMFPRSQSPVPGVHGSFADAERRLSEIAELGFDVVYLPPIHPIGRTHRKGPNNTPGASETDPGSPWAIGGPEGGHTAVNPELGDLEDFEHFVQAAKRLGIEVALDYALQCSPDHPWVREHPEWFQKRPDGSIHYAENPPKKYQDIYPLDFWCEDREALWAACRDIFLFWMERGVRIFRVDNPHTKPFAFWEWCIREVQREHPDVVFLAEAFTRPKRMYGLAKVGFTQSYTYFTWKNTWWELHDYMRDLTTTDVAEYFRPNFFVNTPDILHEYLQRGGRPAFRVRLLLAGTLSPSYGIYSGFELCENTPARVGSEEYLDSEKYQIVQRDWNAPGHIKDDIAALNRVRRESPALQHLTNLAFLDTSNREILCYRRYAPGNELLIAVNLDPRAPQEALVEVPLEKLGLGPDQSYRLVDLLTGEEYTWRGPKGYVRLDPRERPGHVFRIDTRGRP